MAQIEQTINELYHFYILNEWYEVFSFQGYVEYAQSKGVIVKEGTA